MVKAFLPACFMEITPKAMEIEHIRIKRLNLKKEKAYAIG